MSSGPDRPRRAAGPVDDVRRLALGEVLDRTWRATRVLVTGHTGFVGSWLSLLLAAAGAELTGLALDPLPGSLGERLGRGGALGDVRRDVRGDVRDAALVARVVRDARPEIVIHLAAQPLVLASFEDPLATWTTNVIGTANVLEALRHVEHVRACVVVTSDKCYAPGGAAHTESDPLGGEDPYSASKACAELVSHAYRSSFLDAGGCALATARAGNIIGGGDVAADRVLPDCARAAVARVPVRLRHPGAIRPWQHVLDALNGYLRLAHALSGDPAGHTGSWNFGPDPETAATVGNVVCSYLARYSSRAGVALPTPVVVAAPSDRPERAVLTLDSTKSASRLGWSNVLDLETALDWSAEVDVAAAGAAAGRVRAVVADQVARYLSLEGTMHAPALAVRSGDDEGGAGGDRSGGGWRRR